MSNDVMAGWTVLVIKFAANMWAALRNIFLTLSRTQKPYSCLYLHKTITLELDIYGLVISEEAADHVIACKKSKQLELNNLKQATEKELEARKEIA